MTRSYKSFFCVFLMATMLLVTSGRDSRAESFCDGVGDCVEKGHGPGTMIMIGALVVVGLGFGMGVSKKDNHEIFRSNSVQDMDAGAVLTGGAPSPALNESIERLRSDKNPTASDSDLALQLLAQENGNVD